uniref:Uncharacterized protein n=1 Tax=Salix viminalis TaxID=40686 RepID=A0A6N2JXJ7_SALVM
MVTKEDEAHQKQQQPLLHQEEVNTADNDSLDTLLHNNPNKKTSNPFTLANKKFSPIFSRVVQTVKEQYKSVKTGKTGVPGPQSLLTPPLSTSVDFLSFGWLLL